MTRGSRLSALGSRLSALGSRLSALGSRLSALGSRLSALGSRLSALGSRLSALGSRLSALGSRLSALGSRLSALGSRLSALGSRLSALGSRLSALGSRLSALGSRLSALGSRLSALGSRLSALGSRLSALGSLISVCIGSGVRRSPTTLDMPASCTVGHNPLALAVAASSLAPGASPCGCAAMPGSITAAARPASSVRANTASVCCDCFIGRVPRWNRPWVQCKSTGNYTKCTLTCEKYFRISCHFRVSVIISVVHRPGLRPLSLRRATRARPAPTFTPPRNPCPDRRESCSAPCATEVTR